MMKLTQTVNLACPTMNGAEGAAVGQHDSRQAKEEMAKATNVSSTLDISPQAPKFQGQVNMTRILARVGDFNNADPETLLGLYTQARADRETRTKILHALIPHINDLVKSLTHESTSANYKKNILELVHAIQVNHESGRLPLSVKQRSALANVLADVFMARTHFNDSIPELRSRLIDKEVRRMQTLAKPKEFVCNALDLSAISLDGEIETQALTHTRTAKIVEVEGKKYRVKNIKYGNVRAAEEVLMTKFYALSGLDCPNVKLAMNGQQLFDFCLESRRDYGEHADQPENFAVVASELVPAFQDLGRMVLETDVMRPMIQEEGGAARVQEYDQALNAFKLAHQKEQELLELQWQDAGGSVAQNADIIIKMQGARSAQLKARLTMVALLPEHYERSMITAFSVSRLVANWDFENFDLYNFGFNGSRSMLVDFGNCGTMGFGGRQKPDSLERANCRARESDPQAPNLIRKEDVLFDGNVAPSLTGIGSLPRARPVAPLVQSIVKIETGIAHAGQGLRDVAKHDLVPLSPVLEAVFRLSLIPDEAFHYIAKENWPEGTGLFPQYEDDKLRLSADAFANLMIHRRNALTAQFKPSEIHKWEEKNNQSAKNAHHEVAIAVAALTGIFIN